MQIHSAAAMAVVVATAAARLAACVSIAIVGISVLPRDALAQEAAPGKVVVSGVVPDEATRAAIVAKVREVYSGEPVTDQVGVDKLVSPPNWSQQLQKIITPDLKRVRQGVLRVNGNVVEISGTVEDEATRQTILSQLATRLNNPTYTVRDRLIVGGSGQALLDAAMARRTIEFEPGNATLTPAGRLVLDELVPILQKFPGRHFEVIGHTDGVGAREQNIILSAARADAVKTYLVGRGIAAAAIVTSGAGPDRPVADNATPAGRARNRRIELRVLA